MRGVLEGRAHVDAEDGNGVESPVAVGKALCPPMARTLGGLDDGHRTVVVLRERESRAVTETTGGRGPFTRSNGRDNVTTRRCRLR